MKKRTTKRKVAKKSPKKVTKKKVQKVVPKGLVPLGDRIVIKPFSPDEAGTPRASGIIIPETVDKERPEQGRVIAVGSGRYENGTRVPMQVRVGDTVVFSKYGYDEVKWRGEDYFILKEDSILAVIN